MENKVKNQNLNPVLDEHEFFTREKETFYTYVEERQKHSVWLPTVATNALVFEPLDCDFLAALDKAGDYNASSEAYKDTVNNTKLAVVDPDGGKHLLRTNALYQAKQRLCIEGSVFNSFSPAQTAEVLNTCCSVNKKNALLRIADEKLTAWVSANTYAKDITGEDVYREAETELTARLGAADFRKGYYSHTFMDAVYDINEQNSSMRATIDRYRSIVGEDYSLVLSVSTSDTGNSAITIAPRMVQKNNKLSTIPVMGSALRIPHKGVKTMEHLHEQFDMLEGALVKGAEQLEKLQSINVNYSAQALMRAFKKVQIPAKVAMEVVGKWDAMHHDEASTALRLFLAAQEVSVNTALQENNLLKMYRMEDALARMLGINWTALDYPGDLAW